MRVIVVPYGPHVHKSRIYVQLDKTARWFTACGIEYTNVAIRQKPVDTKVTCNECKKVSE
jgi:hypothetical protein